MKLTTIDVEMMLRRDAIIKQYITLKVEQIKLAKKLAAYNKQKEVYKC